MSRTRVVLAVCAAWVAIAIILGAQASLTAALTGAPTAPAVPFSLTLRQALLAVLPWSVVTLAAIGLALRFPLTRGSWRRRVWLHVVAVLALSFLTNVIVVLGFWAAGGQFQGLVPLLRGGLVWGTLRLHVAALIYVGSLAITQVIVSQRRARARELELARIEGQLARAHVQALNAQIRPHFLFNTLHAIGQMWRSGRSDEADTMLDHLGALFHKVQASAARVEIPLAEELEIVREYLAIEQARFRDRLRTRVTEGDGIHECLVPPLLLQPIVENAVRHGISAVSSAGRLDVSAERVDGRLRLTVSDDGPGPDAPNGSAGSGTGLRNTRERLAQLYGTAATLDVRAGNGHGTVVTIEMPLAPLRA